MKKVEVTFNNQNIDSLIEGQLANVNGIPGIITAKEDDTPPNPDVPPGDYFAENITIGQAVIVQGNVLSLRLKDTNALVLKPVQQGNYWNLEWIAEFELPPGQINSLGLAYSGKYTRWIGQSILIYDFSTATWKPIDYHNIGAAIVNITVPITAPSSCVSVEGKIRVKVFSSSQYDFTSFADYMKLSVNL